MDAQQETGWKFRLALQIAAQLPESGEDALAVLDLAAEIVSYYLRPRLEAGSSLPGSAPRRRARSSVRPSGRPR
jgi:hypothetical protein